MGRPELELCRGGRRGTDDWILIAALPGGELIQVSLAPSDRGDRRSSRPIGIYPANQNQRQLYEEHPR